MWLCEFIRDRCVAVWRKTIQHLFLYMVCVCKCFTETNSHRIGISIVWNGRCEDDIMHQPPKRGMHISLVKFKDGHGNRGEVWRLKVKVKSTMR